MATHSSVLAWRIPWTEKPGRLQSMGSHRVGHDSSDLAAAAVAAISFSKEISCSFFPTFLTVYFYTISDLKKSCNSVQGTPSYLKCPVIYTWLHLFCNISIKNWAHLIP